ncbi:MAG: hypothetical protein EBZ77_10455 [Chitinophagia bacterium]|nr:hypothetical protein [Chitinophagia bacterium]
MQACTAFYPLTGKEELLEYAKANAVPYREDASNASDYYTRNIIRHHIVPAMEQYFPGAAGRIQETIGHLAEAEILYNKAIDLERKKLLEQRGNDYYVPINKLVLRQPLSTIVYELMRNFGFHASQTPEVIKLLSAESGHYIVSGTHRIIRNRDFLVITTLAPETADMVVIDQLPATITAGDYTYRFEITERPPELDPDKNIAWLNMAAVEYPILLRKWKTGDYFYPLGMDMKKKKVSRMLINDKVALHEKEKIMVLESGRRIAWVAGMRIDERFKVKPTTEKVLKISREPYSPSK